MNNLDNKNILITGASNGLGKAIAKELGKYNCNLLLTGRKFTESVHAETYECDLSTSIGIKNLISTARQKFDNIDILVNCAGIFINKYISETTEEDFDSTFNLNIKAPFLLTKEFSKDMVTNNWGRIVNIASSSAYGGFPGTSIYCASKHALLGLSRTTYQELKGDNVRTYCFSPGSIKTDMGKKVPGQDFNTFIEPNELSKYIVDTISYDGNMISEEIRINRLFVQ